MKIVLLVTALASFVIPSAVLSQEPKHPFFEDALAKDDFVFRVSTVPALNFVQEKDKEVLSTVFILHLRAGVSSISIPITDAFGVSLIRDGQKCANCEVMYSCPTTAEKRGGDIIFPKDKITRLKVTVFCCSRKFLQGKYSVRFERIRSKYDSTEKLFIPKVGQKGFESEIFETSN